MHRRNAFFLIPAVLAALPAPFGARAQAPPFNPRSIDAVRFADYLGITVGGPHVRGGLPALRLAAARPGSIDDQLVVRRRPGVAASKLAALHTRIGARLIQRIPQLGIEVVQLPSPKAAAAYRADPSVLWASTRKRRFPLVVDPNDPAYNELDVNLSGDPSTATWYKWDSHMVDAVGAWSIFPNRYYDASGKGADAVIIAVLDTGIDYGHPDFVNTGGTASDVAHGGQLVRDLDVSIVNGVATPDAWDVYGHGTHVSGIAAAATNNSVGTVGLGYNANVMSIRVIDADGNGTDSDIAQGIVYAADHGALICNLSLGSYQYSQAEQDAVNYAWRKGTLIVAAAGNDGTNYQFNYPASMSHVLAVSAVSRIGLATYSNYGDPVGIAAPGGDFDYDIDWFLGVYSTLPTYYVPLNDPNVYGASMNYDYLEGTSMASPEVAGLAALYAGMKGITQKTPNGPLKIWQAIQQGADGTGGWTDYYGYGVISASATLNLDAAPNPRGDTVGSVIGQVRYKGTVVQNASVVARPMVGTHSWTSATRADGGYRVPNIPAGAYRISATYFGETLTLTNVPVSAGCDIPGIDFNIGATNTAIAAPDVSTAPGQTVTLSATLTRSDTGAPLADSALDFEVDGASVGHGLTDATGLATVSYDVPADMASGDHTIGVFYTGEGAFNDSSTTAKLTVNTTRVGTFMWIGSDTAAVGQKTHITAWIWRTSDWKGVPSVSFTFSIDGIPVSTVLANGDGGALLEYTVPSSLAAGQHTVSVAFSGNGSYSSSGAAGSLTVSATVPTLLWVQPSTAGPGQKVLLPARLVMAGSYSSLSGKSLTFTVDGQAAGSGITGADGFAWVPTTAPVAAGAHAVVAQFAGDSQYMASTASGTLTVSARADSFCWVGGATVARGALLHTCAWLWRMSDWAGLPGKAIVFDLDGQTIATVVGNQDGGSVLDYTIPTGLSTGAHTLTARFAGDVSYNPCQATSTITVTP